MLSVEKFAEELGVTIAKLKKLTEKLLGQEKIQYTPEEQATIRSSLQLSISSIESVNTSEVSTVKQLESALEDTLTSKQLKTVSTVARTVGLNYLQQQYANLLLTQARSGAKLLDATAALNFQIEQKIYESTGGMLERVSRNTRTAIDNLTDTVNKHTDDLLAIEFLEDLEKLINLEGSDS